MIHLRLLGALDLRDDAGREIHSVLTQPKRVALIAYLAVSGPGRFHRRDALLNLFWPDADTNRARHALRQAVYFLRRSLGDDAVLSRGDEELAVAPDVVTCDVAEFDRLIQIDRLQEALQFYGGDLLPGFHVDGAPEFDVWLEAQRVQLRRRALEASARQLQQLLAEGRLPDALARARWRVETAPAETEPVRQLLLLLERSGDLAAAVQAYEEHAQRLAAEYELEPDEELQTLAARLRTPRLAPSYTAATRTPEPAPAAQNDAEAVAVSSARGRSRRIVMRAAAGGALIVGALTALAALAGRSRAPPLAEDTIAVFPFRVVGPDSSTAYLGEGMADLVSVAFTGGAGPRALEMRTVMRALAEAEAVPDEATRAAARSLGARLLVDASLLSTARGIIVQAVLTETATGHTLGTVHVEGPIDSFPDVAHRLAVELMALATGNTAGLARSHGAPFQAIHAYVLGQAAYRRGDFYTAAGQFREAVRLDSTFAPATFGLLIATSWTGSWEIEPAWKLRDALPERDRAYVEALLGDYIPGGPPVSAVRDPPRAIERWHAYVRRWGDRPEPWYELGDRYLHAGAVAGLDDYLEHAEKAFRDALARDSTFTPAYLHLLDVLIEKQVHAQLAGEVAPARRELRERATRYFTVLAPDARFTTAEAWRAATVLGDEEWLGKIRAGMPSLHTRHRYELHQIAWSAQRYGWPQEDAVRAIDVLVRTASTPDTWPGAITERYALALNAGRPAEAERAADELQRLFPDRPAHLFMRVQAALLGDGLTDSAAKAAEALERFGAAPPAPSLAGRHDQQLAGFHAEVWKLTHGSSVTARATIARIRRTIVQDSTPAWLRPLGEFYAAYLDALLAALERQPNALSLALTADSILQLNWGDVARPWRMWWVMDNAGHTLMMRLYQECGDRERAIAAARRRSYVALRNGTSFLSTRLLVEARLAAQAGDRPSARRAYNHYLALRPAPDPALQPQLNEVRAELMALGRR